MDPPRGGHAARRRRVAGGGRRVRALLEDSSDEHRARTCCEASPKRSRASIAARRRSPPRRRRAHVRAAGRDGDAALARYWLAYGLYQSDNEPDARSVLTALLEQVRGGLHVEPDFEMRLLTSLAAVESRTGQAARALAYLEEARGLAADLDDRRRAAFLFNLAIGYREVGDFEAAIRAGTQGMALYRAAGAIFESARIENDLALAYLAVGQVDRARELAATRAPDRGTGDERWMAAVPIPRRRSHWPPATRPVRCASAATRVTRRHAAAIEVASSAAMITEARALRAAVECGSGGAIRRGGAAARASRVPNRLREVLREWADLRAERATTAVPMSSPARRCRSIEC